MDVFFVATVTVAVILAYSAVRVAERIIRGYFVRIRAVISVASAYDLCCLYRRKIISKRRLKKELSKWAFTEIPSDTEKLKEEWRTLLPPDPYDSFETQVGRAHKDGIIDEKLYQYLLQIKNKKGK